MQTYQIEPAQIPSCSIGLIQLAVSGGDTETKLTRAAIALSNGYPDVRVCYIFNTVYHEYRNGSHYIAVSNIEDLGPVEKKNI